MLKIGLGPVRKKDSPCDFELGARQIKDLSGPGLMFTWSDPG
jgi:hypothetical protein